MSSNHPNPGSPPSPETAQLHSALFFDLVTQSVNLALVFSGRIPHPESGQRVRELDTARLFIDQLEMLEAKTRGNLTPREETHLRQSLMATRMAFVEAVEKSDQPKESKTSDKAPAQEPTDQAKAAETSSPPTAEPTSDASEKAAQEERKKFVKKY